MSSVIFDSLRWLEQPARVTIALNGGPPRAYFQITAPRNIAAICRGRPVEELPRILTLLSPCHHLCAAQALDRLFGVEPPTVAQNMREALRRALFLRNHLRRFYFLVTSLENPFVDFWSPEARRGPQGLRPLLQYLARHIALAQEAVIIMGGRADHPVTAVAGGISRSLKEEHQRRLGEIATACLDCAVHLGEFLHEQVFSPGKILAELHSLEIVPLASLTLAPEPGHLQLRDACGEVERFSAATLFEKVGLRRETWSYEPFAFLREKGCKDLVSAAGGLFFVGPLARLNSGEPMASPLAEAERQRLIKALGPFPHFRVVAAYWALLVQLLESAEALVESCEVEKLSGPVLRTVPQGLGREGYAALESPRGLIYQNFRTDDRGLVEELQILDPATANNGLFGLLAQNAAESSLTKRQSREQTKKQIELSLLAF